MLCQMMSLAKQHSRGQQCSRFPASLKRYYYLAYHCGGGGHVRSALILGDWSCCIASEFPVQPPEHVSCFFY